MWKLVALGALTLAVLAGVAFGVKRLRDERFGPATASTAEEFDGMKDRAIGHCDDSDVDLRIPQIAF